MSPYAVSCTLFIRRIVKVFGPELSQCSSQLFRTCGCKLVNSLLIFPSHTWLLPIPLFENVENVDKQTDTAKCSSEGFKKGFMKAHDVEPVVVYVVLDNVVERISANLNVTEQCRKERKSTGRRQM